jgi:lipid II:glycine glycyltransferase (peptidoglycan interpeptide bridge formation enzyme)
MQLEKKEVQDRNEWNSQIVKAPEFSFLQSWEFGELQKDLGNDVVRYSLVDSGNERNLAYFQLIFISAKRGHILQLRHAPVFTSKFESLDQATQETVIKELITIIKKLGEERSCDFIRLQPLVHLESNLAEIFVKQIKTTGFKPSNIHNIDAEKTLILDITKDDDALLQDMRKQTRYYIRRAKRDGVRVSISQDVSDLREFYEIHHDTTVRQDFSSYSLNYYKSFFENLNVNSDSPIKMEVFLADYKDEKIAGALIIFFGDKAFYSDGGSLTKYSKIPSSYRIQWRAIKRAKELGCKTYNFWGGVSPDKENTNYPWYGIDLFKRGFGGERIEYIHAFDLGLTWKYKLTRIWEFIEKTRRGY